MRNFGYMAFLILSVPMFAASCGESRDGKLKGNLEFCVMDSSFSISVGEAATNCKASYALNVVSYESERSDDSEILRLNVDDSDRAGYANFLAENQKQRAVISIGKVAVRKVIIFGSDTSAVELRFDSSEDVQKFLTALAGSGPSPERS